MNNDTKKILAEHDGDEKDVVVLTDSIGRPEALQAVTEAGLYRLVFMVPSPMAKRLQRWVYHDVLPSIRKHGCYPPPDAVACVGQRRAVVELDHKSMSEIVRVMSLDRLRGGK